MEDLLMVGDDQFEKLLLEQQMSMECDYRICVDCGVALITSVGECICPECGVVTMKNESANGITADAISGPLKINGKGRYYSISADYSKIQRRIIEEQLNRNNSNLTENKLPKNIISAVAATYNTIQQMVVRVCDGKEKKFVRRANVKDEVLAAIIHYQCVKHGVARHTKDIAEFMKLPINGYSRGEDILRTIHREHKLDLPIDASGEELIADRYLEILGINTPANKEFILDVVNTSEIHQICMQSTIGSKIVGAVWMLVQQTGVSCTVEKLETLGDRIKKNTFIKFYTAVQKDPVLFAPIFRRHGITPLPYGSRPKY